MPKWLKVVLALMGVSFLLCVGISAAAYFWIDANKDRLKDVGTRAHNEAEAFAANHDSNECVNEALGRLTQRSGIVDEAEHKIFLRACLEKAERPAGFCDGIPARNQFIATAEWSVKKCSSLGYAGSQPCGRLMGAVQEVCAPK